MKIILVTAIFSLFCFFASDITVSIAGAVNDGAASSTTVRTLEA